MNRITIAGIAILLGTVLFIPSACSPYVAEKEEQAEAEKELKEVTKELEHERSRMERLQDEFTKLTQEVEDIARFQTEALRPKAEELTQKTQEQWKALNRWEYKTLVASATDTPLEDLLNRAGDDGWELVTIADVDGETTLVFKRRPETIFRDIPARDILRLIPLLGGGGGGGS